jgi:hypothetical protein
MGIKSFFRIFKKGKGKVNRQLLVQVIRGIAEEYGYTLTTLNSGQSKDIHLQPYKNDSTGPDEETVRKINQLINKLTPADIKKGVSFEVGSNPANNPLNVLEHNEHGKSYFIKVIFPC